MPLTRAIPEFTGQQVYLHLQFPVSGWGTNSRMRLHRSVRAEITRGSSLTCGDSQGRNPPHSSLLCSLHISSWSPASQGEAVLSQCAVPALSALLGLRSDPITLNLLLLQRDKRCIKRRGKTVTDIEVSTLSRGWRSEEQDHILPHSECWVL